VLVWLSNGAEVKIEHAVSATIEPTPIGSREAIWLDHFHRTGIRASTELQLIWRDAHGHQVAEFKWVEVVGYHVTEPEEKPQ
jgi:hypothetical protein